MSERVYEDDDFVIIRHAGPEGERRGLEIQAQNMIDTIESVKFTRRDIDRPWDIVNITLRDKDE